MWQGVEYATFTWHILSCFEQHPTPTKGNMPRVLSLLKRSVAPWGGSREAFSPVAEWVGATHFGSLGCAVFDDDVDDIFVELSTGPISWRLGVRNL